MGKYKMVRKTYTVKVDGTYYEIEIGGEYYYHGNDVEVTAVEGSVIVFNYLTGECTGEENCCSLDEFVEQNPECEISEED